MNRGLERFPTPRRPIPPIWAQGLPTASRPRSRFPAAHHISAKSAQGFAQRRIAELSPETPLVFICHHGIRSQQAAMYFAAQGFTDVANVEGGIDAWSRLVDPAVPRY